MEAVIENRCVELAASLAGTHAVPGISLALVEDGELVGAHSCGFADLPGGRVLAPSHIFQAASIAKCLTAWAVARLAREGRLDLDSRVEPGVTPRELLSHTAGISLPDIPGTEPGEPFPRLEPKAIAPAGRFSYSGGAYLLLARLLESVTGKRFESYMAETVFEPLGMRESTFEQESPLISHAASGHDLEGRPLPFFRYAVPAAAGLFTTAADLARFAAAHFCYPIDPLVTPVADTARVDGLWAEYGLGYEVERLPGGRVLVGHHGMNRGWRSVLAILPAEGRALAALANGEGAMPALESVLRAWID
jgi:CubicO group peptidase (beta-lactamase class C family)